MEKNNRELEKGGLIVFVLFTMANGINYLYQIMMGRMLSVEDFGTLNSLLSLFMMTAIPSGAITALIAKYLVEYSAAHKTQLIGVFLRRAIKDALIAFALVSLIGVSLSPVIAHYLNIDSVLLVTMVMLLISINLLAATATGAVQGMKQFFALGLLGALLPALKLSISILLVWLGFKLFGALTAITFATLLTLAMSVFYIKQKVNFFDRDPLELDNAAYFKFFLSAFILSACLAILTNMDVVLIKHYRPENETGLYSPAMVLARVILYAPSALVQVMFPLVVEANVKTPHRTYQLFLKVLILNSIVIVICVLGLWQGANIALPILFGEKYLPSVLYILPACMFIVPISFLTVLMNFSIAVDNTKFLTVTMAAGCLLNLILIDINHSSIYQILSVMTFVGLAIFILNMISIGLKYQASIIKKGQQV